MDAMEEGEFSKNNVLRYFSHVIVLTDENHDRFCPSL
jgi:hypothetical protein